MQLSKHEIDVLMMAGVIAIAKQEKDNDYQNSKLSLISNKIIEKIISGTLSYDLFSDDLVDILEKYTNDKSE